MRQASRSRAWPAMEVHARAPLGNDDHNGALVATWRGSDSQWTGTQLDTTNRHYQPSGKCFAVGRPDFMADSLRDACACATWDEVLALQDVAGAVARGLTYLEVGGVATQQVFPVCDNIHYRAVLLARGHGVVYLVDSLSGATGWNADASFGAHDLHMALLNLAARFGAFSVEVRPPPGSLNLSPGLVMPSHLVGGARAVVRVAWFALTVLMLFLAGDGRASSV